MDKNNADDHFLGSLAHIRVSGKFDPKLKEIITVNAFRTFRSALMATALLSAAAFGESSIAVPP